MKFVQTLTYLCLDFLYPPRCALCQEEGSFVCHKCRSALPLAKVQHCPICHCQSPFGATCVACQTKTELTGLLVAFPYEYEPIEQLIKTFKYRYAEDLAELFAHYLAELFPAHSSKKTRWIAPVPLHWKKQAQRGFCQTELLARHVAPLVNGRLVNCLKRVKYTVPQAQLSKQERQKNVRNCFTAKEVDLSEGTYILVDDVASTLSTLNECAAVLKANGVQTVWACVIARGT